MRITQLELYRNFLSDIETLNAGYSKASRQVSSGKKLMQLSDSPQGSADLVALSEKASKIDLYSSNIETASFFLGVTESALNEVHNLITSVYALGSQASSDAAGDDARTAIAVEIRSLRDQILALANSEALGRYIFSGSRVLTAPFELSGGSVLYHGDGEVNSIRVGEELELELGVPGSEAFDSIFVSIEALLTALDANDIEGIRNTLGQFSSSMSDLSKVRGRIGSQLSLLENAKANLESQQNILTTRRSQIEDADMAKAIMQMNQTQTALDAAISAGGAILSQSNLFDILG
jgi:flagellar hook-associated protein 3 FlgL